MPSQAKLYLESYRSRFMEMERICRYRITAWQDVMKEVVIDRGALLGSEQYRDMSGVEKSKMLNLIDEAVSLCYNNIQRLREDRDRAIPVKRFFSRRCARIRSQIMEMSDEDLGKKEDDE